MEEEEEEEEEEDERGVMVENDEDRDGDINNTGNHFAFMTFSTVKRAFPEASVRINKLNQCSIFREI